MPILTTLLCGALVVVTIALWRKRILSPEIAIVAVFAAVLATISSTAGIAGGLTINSGSATSFYLEATQCLSIAHRVASGALVLLLVGVTCGLFLGAWGSEVAVFRHPSINLESRKFVENTSRSVVLVAGLLMAYAWLANGAGIIRRDSYQFLEPGSLVAALTFISIPLGIAVAATIPSTKGLSRGFAILVFILVLAYQFGTASRGFSIVVAAPFVLAAVRARSTLLRLTFVIISGVVAFVSIALVIQLRGLPPPHGLASYLSKAASEVSYFDPSSLTASLNNLLLSVPVTYFSTVQPLPAGFFGISMNPLPGSVAGWYEINSQLSLGNQTPSNAYGQLLNGSALDAVFRSVILAFVLQIPRFARLGMGEREQRISSVVGILFVLVASTLFMQYSLRSGMRFVWLAVGVSLVLLVYTQLVGDNRRRTSPRATGNPRSERLQKV